MKVVCKASFSVRMGDRIADHLVDWRSWYGRVYSILKDSLNLATAELLVTLSLYETFLYCAPILQGGSLRPFSCESIKYN